MNDNAKVLRGTALWDFLNRARQLLPSDTPEGDDAMQNPIVFSAEERRAAVRELLATQPLAPEALHELDYLCSLWQQAESSEKACTVLEQFTEPLLSILQGDEKLKAQVHLSLNSIGYYLDFDKNRGLEQLQKTAENIRKLPRDCLYLEYDDYGGYDDYWDIWKVYAERYAAWDLAEQALEWQCQQEKKLFPGKESQLRIEYSNALACARLFRLRSAKSSEEKRRWEQCIWKQVRKAIALLSQFEYGKEIDTFSPWSYLAGALLEGNGIPLLPEAIPELLEAAQKYLQNENPPASPLVCAIRKSQSAKLLLKMHALTGNWQAAAEIGKKAWFNTEDDAAYQDKFGGFYLLALEKTGNLGKAAPLMLECVFHSRHGVSAIAYEIAQRGLADNAAVQSSQTRAIFLLVVGWCAIDPEMKSILRDNKIPLPQEKGDKYFKQARTIAPNDSYIDVLLDYIDGWRKASYNKWEKALPLLERAVKELPQFAMSNTLVKLWCARFAVLGKQEALARPWYLPQGATWSYYTAQKLHDPNFLFENQCVSKKHTHILPPEEVRNKLALYYYKESLRRFDVFVETGQGEFTDCTTVLGYADLCLEIGDIYTKEGRLPEAIALFEHASGCIPSYVTKHEDILRARYSTELQWQIQQNKDAEAILSSAEHLWELRRGCWYVASILPAEIWIKLAELLKRINRPLEIFIWVERLQSYIDDMQKEEEEERGLGQEAHYCLAILRMLALLPEEYSEQTHGMLKVQQKAVSAMSEGDIKIKCQQLLDSCL